MDLKEIQKKLRDYEYQINILKDMEFEVLHSTDLERGDIYYYIDCDGRILHSDWSNHAIDGEFLYIGNVFKTKEIALFEVERRKVITELKKFSKDFKFGAYNYYLSLIMSSKCFCHNISYDIETDRKVQGVIYFESEEIAREVVEAVGEDRIKKYIFGVE